MDKINFEIKLMFCVIFFIKFFLYYVINIINLVVVGGEDIKLKFCCIGLNI